MSRFSGNTINWNYACEGKKLLTKKVFITAKNR